MTAFDNLSEIAPNVIWEGVIGRSLHGTEAMLAAIELERDADVPEHAHVNEQIGILIGGGLTFRIGDEEQELRPGATWVILRTRRIPSLRPEGATPIEVFAPPRTDWAGHERLPPSAPRGFSPVTASAKQCRVHVASATTSPKEMESRSSSASTTRAERETPRNRARRRWRCPRRSPASAR